MARWTCSIQVALLRLLSFRQSSKLNIRKRGTIVIGHKMVAASIELADLLVEVACLGGVFGFMDKAITLGPNALKESP